MLFQRLTISFLILILVVPQEQKSYSIPSWSLKHRMHIQVVISGAFLRNQLAKLHLCVEVCERELNTPNFAEQVNSFLPLINFAACLSSL